MLPIFFTNQLTLGHSSLPAKIHLNKNIYDISLFIRGKKIEGELGRDLFLIISLKTAWIAFRSSK